MSAKKIELIKELSNDERLEYLHRYLELVRTILVRYFDDIKTNSSKANIKCPRPWDSQFLLSGTDIIRELGWDKRTDISLSTKLLELANTAFALDCLLIKAVWEDPKRKNGKTRVAIDTSRMWNVRVKLIGQMDLSGNVDSPEELYWLSRS